MRIVRTFEPFVTLPSWQGLADHKKNQFTSADQDLQAALTVSPHDGTVLYYDGLALSNLMQDDAARQRFAAYAKQQKPGSMLEQRALRYVSDPGLGRARMAPPFEFTTIDGQHYSLDDLQGKVVLHAAAYSFRTCFRIGNEGSASFQRARKLGSRKRDEEVFVVEKEI